MSTLINQYFSIKNNKLFFKIKNLKKIIRMPITEYNVLSYDFLEFLYLNEIISNCNSNNNLFYSE
jgi:hypothetical protein